MSMNDLLFYYSVCLIIGAFSASTVIFLLLQRRRTLAALRRSEESYRRIVENSHDIIYAINPNGVLTFASASWTVLLGYHLTEAIGRPLQSFIHPNDAPICESLLTKTILTGQRQFGVEYRIRHHDGAWRWHRSNIAPIPETSGRIVSFVIIASDITAYKLSEIALHQSESLLKDVLDSLSAHIAVLDANGIITLINAAWRRFAEQNGGVAAPCQVGSDYLAACRNAVIHQNCADAQAALHGILEVLNGAPDPFHWEYLCASPTERRWFIMHVFRLSGFRPGVVIAHEDITVRKRTEEALSRRETTLNSILRAAPIGIGLIYNRIFLEANHTLCQMTGYAPSEIIGKNARLLYLCDQDYNNVGQEKYQQISEKGVGTIETLWRRKNGEVINILLSSAPLDNENPANGVTFTALDITDRKRMEKNLRRSLGEKEALLREVHHRVKNNLAAMISLLDLQRDSVTDTSYLSLLKDLSGRIKSMALVHEMLYQSDNLSRIDFHDYLRSLIGYLHSAFDPQSAIRLNVAATGIWMPLDAAIPCGLIINELVTNAFKYAFPDNLLHKNDLECEISIQVLWENTQYTVSVSDNGVGLPDKIDWQTARTLGLRLVRMLGRHQLQGTLAFDCTSGTRATLRFDANPQWDKSAHG